MMIMVTNVIVTQNDQCNSYLESIVAYAMIRKECNLRLQQKQAKRMMQIMQLSAFNQQIPEKIGDLKIRRISWADFRGKCHPDSPYSAHIYWNIDYQIILDKKKKPQVRVDVRISPKSWVLEYNKSYHLLMHEYGHYLIGCMCALTFQKRVNITRKQPSTMNFNDWCRIVFKETLEQYLKLERLYDQETNHRLDIQQQQLWQESIIKELNLFKEQFQRRKIKEFKIHKYYKPRVTTKQ